MCENETKLLKRQVSSLKKQVGVLAIISLLFGSGGIFGTYKWIVSEKKLTAVEIRKKDIETEIIKYDALYKFYSNQILELERQIKEKDKDLEEIKALKLELSKFKYEQQDLNNKYRKYLPEKMILPPEYFTW